jgi:GTPase Era involved in 16S rRNA processing
MLQNLNQLKGKLIIKFTKHAFYSSLKWKQSVEECSSFFEDSKTPCILIKNKIDLLPVDKQDNIDELKKFSEANGFCGCFNTSAKTGKNIGESMEFLVEEIRKKLEDSYSIEQEIEKERLSVALSEPETKSVTLEPEKHIEEESKKRKKAFAGCCKWEL